MTSDSVRRGGVSRVVDVTKPVPRWGWRFWYRNSAILVRYHDVIPCDDREIVLRGSESRENPTRGPGRSGCVAIIPTRLKGLFVCRCCGVASWILFAVVCILFVVLVFVADFGVFVCLLF